MVDDHRTRVGPRSRCCSPPREPETAARRWCRLYRADLAGGGAVLGIDRYTLSLTGVDITELGGVRDNGGILRQGQLPGAVGVYEYSLRRIVEVPFCPFSMV